MEYHPITWYHSLEEEGLSTQLGHRGETYHDEVY